MPADDVPRSLIAIKPLRRGAVASPLLAGTLRRVYVVWQQEAVSGIIPAVRITPGSGERAIPCGL